MGAVPTIPEVNASRKLDLLVAKAMGWTDIRLAPPDMQEHGEDYWGKMPYGDTSETCIPHFSEDFISAWDVVDRLENIFDFAWILSSEANTYAFRIWNDLYYNSIVGRAKTVPLAICQCALEWAKESGEISEAELSELLQG